MKMFRRFEILELLFRLKCLMILSLVSVSRIMKVKIQNTNLKRLNFCDFVAF